MTRQSQARGVRCRPAGGTINQPVSCQGSLVRCWMCSGQCRQAGRTPRVRELPPSAVLSALSCSLPHDSGVSGWGGEVSSPQLGGGSLPLRLAAPGSRAAWRTAAGGRAAASEVCSGLLLGVPSSRDGLMIHRARCEVQCGPDSERQAEGRESVKHACSCFRGFLPTCRVALTRYLTPL